MHISYDCIHHKWITFRHPKKLWRRLLPRLIRVTHSSGHSCAQCRCRRVQARTTDMHACEPHTRLPEKPVNDAHCDHVNNDSDTDLQPFATPASALSWPDVWRVYWLTTALLQCHYDTRQSLVLPPLLLQVNHCLTLVVCQVVLSGENNTC